MSVYRIISDLSKRYAKIANGGFTDNITIDLDKRIIRSGRLNLLEQEKIVLDDRTTYEIKGHPFLSETEKQNPWETLQELYDQYITSSPWGSSKKSYFIPKRSDELTNEELSRGIPRNEARIKLEAYILLGSLEGVFEWTNPEHWFWKGENGLVVYRKWIMEEK